MERPFVISMLFVAPSQVAAVGDPSSGGLDEWADPQDPASLVAREASVAALQRALARAAPGLRKIDNHEDRAGFLADLIADGISAEVAAARMRRRIMMFDAADSEIGGLFVEVADQTAKASLTVLAFTEDAAALAQVDRLAAVATVLCNQGGLIPCDRRTRRPLGASDLLQVFAEEKARLTVRSKRDLRRGWFWFAGVQAMIALLVGGLWIAAAKDAQFLDAIDMDRPLTLIVEGRGPVRHVFGIMAEHPVIGRVQETGASAETLLDQRAWFAARKGARLMVFDAGFGEGRLASVTEVARAAPVFAVAGIGVSVVGTVAAAIGAGRLGSLGWVTFAWDAARRRRLRSRLATMSPILLRVGALIVGFLAAVMIVRRTMGFT